MLKLDKEVARAEAKRLLAQLDTIEESYMDTQQNIETIKAAIAAKEAELAELRIALQKQTNAQATPFGSHMPALRGHPHPAMIRLQQTLSSLRHDLARAESPS